MVDIVYDFDPRNLPKDMLAAIGLIVACSSQAESLVAAAIGGCIGVDAEYNMAVTNHMTLPLKFSVLRSVAEIRIDDLDELDKLDEVLEKLDKELGKRHNYAHQQLCRNPNTGDLFRVKVVARERLDAGLVKITENEVRADAANLYDASMMLMTLLIRNGLLPPIPSQLRPRGHKSKAARKKRRQK